MIRRADHSECDRLLAAGLCLMRLSFLLGETAMPLFGKKADKNLTRLFYATDLHGSERTFRKFLNAGKFYGVNVLIMGGDIIGKIAIPIIDEGGGRYRATLQGTTEHPESQEDLKRLTDRIETLGFYYKTMPEDEFKAVFADTAKIDALFHELARKRLEEWVDLAGTRLAGTGIRCFVTGGNDDYPDVLEALPHQKDGTEPMVNCESDVVQVSEGHSMISLGWSTPTPWDTPREVTDEELGTMIEKLVRKVSDVDHCIFNFHDPPVDSTLDTCPQLDWDTDPPSPIFKSGQMVMFGAGSVSVRKAIETHQPMLGIHGHIHESQGMVRIGRTVCINPGSEYGEGILRGCIVTFANGAVEGYQMTTG
jgi:Icc-related predicted phosphoesterase